MTVPHLGNCPHDEAGWCLDCVATLGNRNWELQDALRPFVDAYNRLGFEHLGNIENDDMVSIVVSVGDCRMAERALGKHPLVSHRDHARYSRRVRG